MIGARLQDSTLTSKADYSQYFTVPVTISKIGSQWSIENNTLLSARFFLNPPSSTSPYINWRTYEMSYIGTTHNNDQLEYGVIVYRYGTNTILTETDFYDSGTTIPIYGEADVRGSSAPACTYEVYIRRKDGGILTPSDMEQSTVSFMQIRNYEVVYTTAIPQNWLETTTQSIPTYTTQTTMVTTVDYESFLTTLTVPVDIRPAIAQFDQIINDLWSLHYIPFLVCFALIMGLAIWLLH